RVDPKGRNVFFGVRECGMMAMVNGMAAHGGLIPFGSTFFVFTDYCRPALRLSALMGVHSLFVFTHDSIGLGEDGPTHQPIEHVESLRLIPNLCVWRPCDAVETVEAWRTALERTNGPTAIVLSRQALAHQPRTRAQIDAIRRGGYALIEPAAAPEAVIIATGSEVQLACAAASELA